VQIRPYKPEDYEKVGSWWAVTTGEIILPTLYNSKWSYVVELDNAPVACVSLLLTNSPEFAYLNALVGDPQCDHRAEAVELLMNTLEEEAKILGFKRILLFAENDKLINYYQAKNFKKTKNLTCLSKEL
jgi:N-acetylglutamate synthase-like GNAT family acetyltransferase